KILTYIGLIPKIEKAPITLNGLLIHNPFKSKSEIINYIAQHYFSSILKQTYLVNRFLFLNLIIEILGSLDFLGNPVNLFSNIGSGFSDFFYEPAKGLVVSPKEFGK